MSSSKITDSFHTASGRFVQVAEMVWSDRDQFSQRVYVDGVSEIWNHFEIERARETGRKFGPEELGVGIATLGALAGRVSAFFMNGCAGEFTVEVMVGDLHEATIPAVW